MQSNQFQPAPPPKSGGSQKYIRGDPCDLGSEAKNRGSAPPPEMGGAPPETKSWLRPWFQLSGLSPGGSNVAGPAAGDGERSLALGRGPEPGQRRLGVE